MTADAFDGVRSATVDGISLAYREQGNGEPVVFVHGTASDLRTWDQQLAAIGTQYRAIAYSRRYARPNQDIEPGADDQMLPHVDDLTAFMRSLDIPAAHLVGHSWGGFIALLTAMRHPEMVRSIVLLEPPVLTLFVSMPPRPGELLSLLLRRPVTALTIVRFGATTMAPAQKAFQRGDDEAALRIFGEGVFGKEHFARISEERLQQCRENIESARAQLLGAGFPPLDDDEVRSVRVPVLMITGEHSPPLFHRLTDRLQELLPKAERTEIPGVSHLMHEDNASVVNDRIVGFLNHHAAPTSS